MGSKMIFLLCALILGACTSMPPGEPAPLPPTPAAFKEADPPLAAINPALNQPNGDWWKVFADPVLSDLIDRANRGNTSIQQAVARLKQARALVRNADANRSIQAGVNLGVSRQTGPLINAAGGDGTLINTGINLSYETDFFGRLAGLSDSASRDAQAREALLQSARLLVQTDLAQSYFSLRGLDAERAVLRLAASSQADAILLNERRLRAGLITDIDAERQRMTLTATDADLSSLERQRAILEHAMAVLAGEVASNFSIAEREWATALPVIPSGVPSSVLARRPDVAAAQQSMLAAQARLGAAQTAWFPNLSLTASGGYASPDLSNLLSASMLQWAISGVLSLPLFDGGKREAALNGSAAELELLQATYREQILIAFRDVEDQLASLRLLAAQADIQQRAVKSAARIATLSDSRFRSGLVSKLEVLEAHQSELLTQRKVQQVRSSQYQVTVALVKALGGSW